jgi:hypothetical protein
MTIQHVVLFSFPGEPTTDQAAEIRRQVVGWPEAIPGIRSLRFGEAMFTERTRGYQFLLYTEFDSVDDLRSYQSHPVHQTFVSWLRDNDVTPLAFDYPLNGDTVLVPASRDLSSKE